MPQTNHHPKTMLDQSLAGMGVDLSPHHGSGLTVKTPIDGSIIARLKTDTTSAIHHKMVHAKEAFQHWRLVPAPIRGDVIRCLGLLLRQHKDMLAAIITLESGKILEEAKGEVQEMIDICEFAVGLSRQLHGLTLPSERPQHLLHENWYPLGVIGIISAFNFPVAVWAWNATLALVCGNTILWKPSERTPVCALACQHLLEQAYRLAATAKPLPPFNGISGLVIGDANCGDALVKHHDIALISATGSCHMGRHVAEAVARRIGKALLELGGNNAVIITPSANLDITLPSLLFGAVGTTGQRCTTTRRAFVHTSLYDQLVKQLNHAYNALAREKIGNPLNPKTLIGPLIHEDAYESMKHALAVAHSQGARVECGKRTLEEQYPQAFYVEPALVAISKQIDIVRQETFAPILYVMPYDNLEEALALHNDVSQGLSSAIFTNDLREAEYFKQYSDCGIANVNIGTSGAEIGGAFGGEKETGGGRESGSDAWKQYMRRQTSTTYWGKTAPMLAQGIHFDVR